MREEMKASNPVVDVLKSVWQEYCSEDASTSSTDITDDGMMCQLLRDLNDGWSLVDAIDTIEQLEADKAEMYEALHELIGHENVSYYDNSMCHKGLCSAEECSNCGRKIRAIKILAKARGESND